ncbi:hypothetical protein DICPUDRAFT_148651 [Dictyostelium purpureum]|uniref:Malonyl-CoA:ACP transacylase (MAT) domain-containing protein n=1 Tax=Dictyostelium purpureum TaxID=5786 RepID=F0ZBN0_DICPU|nr:uncharacterized protein DICPUDRAFT_148651 [Dictyostelium purpureum]EGC38650.1 hypothetical protein DICPUDRAFT_148651 [Dictyostelium purpureum]|eukprot:XP_003284843.1 hypothetical protein DICPUDRAFT_148651 [Dictyostelium purpureum]
MENNHRPLIFIFSGQVVNWERIAEELYNKEPVFKKWVHRIDSLMHEFYNYSVLEKVKNMPLDERNKNTDILINHSFLMMYQISLFKLYKHYGVHPNILMSHSIGEFSAAYCSGMIDLRTAVKIQYNRNLILKNEGGTLLSVNMSEEDYKTKFSKDYPNFEIACINTHKNIVLGGWKTELEQFSEILSKKFNIFNVFFGSVVSVHTKYVERFAGSMHSYKLKNKQPKIPIISCHTGQLFKDSFLFDEKYNYFSFVNPVNFNLGMINVLKYLEDNKLGDSPITVEITPQVMMVHSLKEIYNNLPPSYFKKEEMIKNIFTFTKMNQFKQFYSSLKKIYYLQYNIQDNNTTTTTNEKNLDDKNPNSLIEKNILNFISKQFEINPKNLEITLGELGADSLFLVGLRRYIDEEYTDNIFTISQLREFKIQDIIITIINEIKNPTKSTKYDIEFWENEIILDPNITPKYNKINNYNLNGSSVQDAYDSLINGLKTHELFGLLNKMELSKIEPVLGDLLKPQFNLSNQQYDYLSNSIDIIVNSAANVDLNSNYVENKEANVNGVLEIIKFAFLNNLKKLMTFSTVAIYLNNEFDTNGFNDNRLVTLDKLNNIPGYAQSKVVGEYLLREAANRGLDIINIRPPFIYANPNNGVGNDNDLLQLFIQCSYAVMAYPNLSSDFKVFQVPITWLSANIVQNFTFNLSLWNNNLKFKSYNLFGSHEPIEKFFGYLEEKYPLKMIEYDEWVKKISESKEMCCIRLKTFHNLNFAKNLYFSNTIKMTDETIGLITKDWEVTKQMVYKNINHIFKLNISKSKL